MLAALGTLLDLNVIVVLAASGAAYTVVRRQWPTLPAPLLALLHSAPEAAPALLTLLGLGLRVGLLTFGGAYTAIPLLRHDVVGRWVSEGQFLDGLALAGIVPTPLIMFTAFIGYLAHGLPGALTMTVGVFAPAFAFTLLGHRWLERAVDQPALRAALDGVTAGVVGLIAASAPPILRSALPDPWVAALFAAVLLALHRWRHRWALPAVMLGAGAAGMALRLLA